MAKENKSTRTDEKKSSPKTNLKDMIKAIRATGAKSRNPSSKAFQKEEQQKK